ncbi:HD-GYP domain-containing protein [uncultured Pseudodesulfovibrio sp.]|uniref:HD-GYP domain-containing protein n=1 Tax=uncultured Pseudodesulfovibrio sp. TaxID=2035858 RepID=UPI0029C79FDE|nr:HD-GYP domain-containing protein [uncultured Pseudodesulfovibrio sp.]
MIKKISIDELEQGMEVVELSSEMWKHLPYLYTDPGIIESSEQIATIKKDGYQQVFVKVDNADGQSDEKRLDALLQREDTPLGTVRTPFSEAIQTASVTYESAMSYAMRIVNDAKLGRKIDYESAVETASAIVDSAVSNPDTLICLSKLSSFDNYTYTHCINVAAIAVVFGEFIGMSRDDLILLGMAGMMHDLGKTTVPGPIVNKAGRLTKYEYEEMKRHPAYGCSILSKSTSIPTKVLKAIRLHHEKFNGTGYPDGLKRKDIPAFARILCLADIYDALTSDRCYKNAILPNKALGIMYGMRDQDFDSTEVQLFIKCLGIFPSGSFVRLNTGNYALVFESNPKQPLYPKIRVVMDKQMHPIKAMDIDLANQIPDEFGSVEIMECADPSGYRQNLMEFMTLQ